MFTDNTEHMRGLIHESMRLKETNELLEIWWRQDHEEWTDLAFDVLKGILLERLGEIPSQEDGRNETEPDIEDEQKEEVVEVQEVELNPKESQLKYKQYMKTQIYESMRLMETDELLEIRRRQDHEEWTDQAFEVVKEILQARIGEIPPQDKKEKLEPGIIDSDLTPEERSARANKYIYEAQLVYDHENDFEKALFEIDLAIEYKPDSADAHNLRGLILDALDRTDEAILEYRKALELDPNLDDAKDNLTDALAVTSANPHLLRFNSPERFSKKQ